MLRGRAWNRPERTGTASDGRSWISRRLHGFLRQEATVDICHGNRSLHWSEVGDYDCTLNVEPQEGGTPSAWQAPGGAINYPIFTNELLGDERDCAPL